MKEIDWTRVAQYLGESSISIMKHSETLSSATPESRAVLARRYGRARMLDIASQAILFGLKEANDAEDPK